MNDHQAMMVFMHVQAGMSNLTKSLLPIPTSILREWVEAVKANSNLTPAQIAMRDFHIIVIEAFITAREYAQNDNIKNN